MMQAISDIGIRHAQKIRFVISGSGMALFGIAALFVFADLLHVWYTYSVTIFVIKKGRVELQMSLFFIVSIINLGLNTFLMYALVDRAGIHHLLSQAFVMVALSVVNYVVYRTIVFKVPVQAD